MQIPRESSIVGAIVRALEGHRCKVIKTHGDVYIPAGTPDLIGCRYPDGRAFAIEVKRPGEKPTSRQEIELLRWSIAGALAGVATNVEEALRIVWPEGRPVHSSCSEGRVGQEGAPERPADS